MTFGIALVLSLVGMQLYFRFAQKFNILDVPNERSSHSISTYRGGGIVFLLGAITAYLGSFDNHYFLIGLLLISLVSLADDIYTLPTVPRALVQILAILFLFYDSGVFSVFWLYLILSLVFSVGVVNAFNFMDGINGMTALYSLTAVLSCYFAATILNIHVMLALPLIASLLVFAFYNVRFKARCFAGDVGAVSIAFCVIFMIVLLMRYSLKSEVILFLVIYGADSVLTILERVFLKENIFKPHQRHLYQQLVHKSGLKHLSVSCLYALSQLVISIIVLLNLKENIFDDKIFTVTIIATVSAVYVMIKLRVLNHK